jgi:F-type H+-transporting ATPase subunit alpha
MAQYRDVAAFAQFASDLDVATQRQLTRGQRLTELLKQDLATPFTVEDQVISMFAGGVGVLDGLTNDQVKAFEFGLLKFVRDQYPEIAEGIASTKALSKESEGSLEKGVREYAEIFKKEGAKAQAQYNIGQKTLDDAVKAGVQEIKA